MSKIEKQYMKESLFRFLESIYFFEQYETTNFGLNWNEIYLLQIVIRNPGVSVTEIARYMKSKTFVISRMIQKMKDSGFIEKVNDKKDKRVYLQYITEEGLKKIDEIEEFNHTVLESQLSKMTKDHSEFILSILDNLGELLKVPNQGGEIE